jgi:hypothetical protein
VKIKILLFSIVGILSLQIAKPAKAGISETVQEVGRAALNIGMGYAAAWLASFIHEMGHAGAFYAVYQVPGHIYMGNREKIPFLSLTHLTIHDFQLDSVFQPPSLSDQKIKAWKNVIYIVAGPLAQIFSSLLFLRYLKMPNFMRMGFLSGISDGIANLIPDGGSDGSSIFREIMGRSLNPAVENFLNRLIWVWSAFIVLRVLHELGLFKFVGESLNRTELMPLFENYKNNITGDSHAD